MQMGITLITAVLAVAINLAGVSAPVAATDTVGGDDLFCDKSLGQAYELLNTLYAEIEASVNPVEGAKLRRAHGDWVRFRGSDCAFAAPGEAASQCCLQRQTEERIDTLRLYQAQLRPVSFRTWEDPIRPQEKADLLKRVTGRGPSYSVPVLPDQILRVGAARYLLSFGSTVSEARGMHYVDLGQQEELMLLEGSPNVLRVLPDRGDARHVVVMCDTIDQRIRWRELYTVELDRLEERLAFRKRRLALFREDAGAGRCDRHSAEFLRLDKAMVPGEVRFTDLNGDNLADISLTVAEIDCRTQVESEHTLTFLAGDEGFDEGVRSDL